MALSAEQQNDESRELAIAATTEPEPTRFPAFGFAPNVIVGFGTAMRADHLSVGPTQLDGVVESAVRIGEVNDGFL